jgi:hypothetical protein
MLVLHAKVQIKIDCMVTQRYYRQSKHDLLLIALVEIKIHFVEEENDTKAIQMLKQITNKLHRSYSAYD